MKGYDVLGNIAIVKFERRLSLKEKVKQGHKILNENKSVKTILEKKDKFKGRLRTLKTKFILGIDTKEAIYRENNCVFRLNVESCYFSPRLANERLEIAKMIKKGESVLVLFSGVGPFPIVVAKHSTPKRIVSVELGKECCKYAKENSRLNKTNIEVLQGDVNKLLPKIREKFDRIIMPRPNLKDSFLKPVLSKIKKKGIIHYYGFYSEDDVSKLKDLIVNESFKAKKRIKILKIKKAGDIGVKKFRYRVDFKVLN